MSVEGPQMAMADIGLRPVSNVDDMPALHDLSMDGGHGGEDPLTEPVLQAIEEGFVGNPDQGTTDQQEQEDLYRNLPLPPNGIRVLQLLPNPDKTAPIECRLTISLLGDSSGGRPYEALSYTWGSADNPEFITVNGRWKLAVGRNLHSALLRLRDHSVERNMWIDAVCINQSQDALKERSQQVQSMAKIYAQATTVLVWLGEAADDSDQTLEQIRLAAESSTSQPVDETSVLALLARPWFERFWVLQEVAAARHVLIQCGSVELEGYTFCLGLNALNNLPLPDTTYPVSFLMRASIFRPRRVANQREGRFSLNIRPLSELIDMYHTRKATDLRDKVYALLGMCSDDPAAEGLLADYEKSWAQVFRQLIQFVLSPRAQISVRTWSDRQVAVVECRGSFLGEISSVGSDKTWQDRQSVLVTWADDKQFQFTVQLTAKSLRAGDMLYLVQGASKPTVVRFCGDHWAVIMIGFDPQLPVAADTTSSGWPAGFSQHEPPSARTIACPLVWSWDSDDSQYQPEIEDGEWNPLKIINQLPGTVDATAAEPDLRMALAKANRLQTVRSELQAIKRYGEAAESFRMAMGTFESILKITAQCGKADSESNKQQLDSIISSAIEEHGYWTVLCVAAAGRHTEVFKLLLALEISSKVDLDAKHIQTALWLATRRGHEAAVKALLDRDAGLATLLDNPKSEFDERYLGKALVLAAESGNWMVAKLLLDDDRFDPEADYISMVLKVATKSGCDAEPIVSVMLGSGKVDPAMRLARAVRDSVSGGTLLHWAAKEGQQGVVKLLLSNSKVKSSVTDFNNCTAMHWAARLGHRGIVELLLDNMVDPRLRDIEGCTAIHWAAREGHEAIIELLLKTGMDPSTKDLGGYTAMEWARWKGHQGVVEILSKNGVGQ